LFADIVLIGEIQKEVNSFEKRRTAFEGKGLNISRSKTEYMEYDFGERERGANRDKRR